MTFTQQFASAAGLMNQSSPQYPASRHVVRLFDVQSRVFLRAKERTCKIEYFYVQRKGYSDVKDYFDVQNKFDYFDVESKERLLFFSLKRRQCKTDRHGDYSFYVKVKTILTCKVKTILTCKVSIERFFSLSLK